MQNPANLNIWHRSLALAVQVDTIALLLPGERMPGVRNQIRRASTSIPANIAEGVGSDSPLQCARFLSIAIGSAFELESHLTLIQRLAPHTEHLDETIDETQQIRRMMYAYRRTQLRRAEQRGR
jgi:four helix bundle protein